jgi:hypothetical protein
VPRIQSLLGLAILIALSRLPLARLLLALLAGTLSAAALLLPAASTLLLSATLAGLLLLLTRTRVLLVGVLLVGIGHAVLPRGVGSAPPDSTQGTGRSFEKMREQT